MSGIRGKCLRHGGKGAGAYLQGIPTARLVHQVAVATLDILRSAPKAQQTHPPVLGLVGVAPRPLVVGRVAPLCCGLSGTEHAQQRTQIADKLLGVVGGMAAKARPPNQPHHVGVCPKGGVSAVPQGTNACGPVWGGRTNLRPGYRFGPNKGGSF